MAVFEPDGLKYHLASSDTAQFPQLPLQVGNVLSKAVDLGPSLIEVGRLSRGLMFQASEFLLGLF